MPGMVVAIPNPLQPAPSQASLQCGSYEINGTTYFTPQVPVAPLPPNPMFYDHATIAHDSYDSAIYTYSQPDTSFKAPNYVYDQATYPEPDWQAHNWSNPQVLESNMPEEQGSVTMQDSNQPATSDFDEPSPRLTSTREDEFPYRPPKNQRVGHARRISVQIKVDTLSLTAAA
jgi:hypothetical protein